MGGFFNFSDSEIQGLYDGAKSEVFDNDAPMSAETESAISEIVEQLEHSISFYERLKLRFGSLLDYNALKKEGKTTEELKAYRAEDSAYLEKVDGYYKNNLDKRDYMFGYPSNMETDSYICKYLRFLESKLYLMNNCGDPYQTGNYGMDSKETEREIIDTFAKNLGLIGGYWGYITTGGTESNFWGIREGFNRYPCAKLYFSEKTHYSVEKFVSNNRIDKVYPYTVIPSEKNGAISVSHLKSEIEKDLSGGKYNAVVLVLTWGTTKEGAIDPVNEITDYLIEKGINYYCHLDAALLGGIACGQNNAPWIGSVAGLNVDSVSISLHKYLGMARANGILLALKHDKRKVIDYIGQEDSTMLGSRDYLPFSTYQRVKEFYYRKPSDHYIRNVEYFKNLLKENKIAYRVFNEETCNIFVIDKPEDAICKKYQLTTFTDYDGEKAHIIIFPFHKKEIMQQLVNDLIHSC